MKSFVRFKTIVTSTIITLIISGVYILISPKTYKAKSQALILRTKLDEENFNTEESKNRWIWIRDGLNLKTLVTSDLELINFINANKQDFLNPDLNVNLKNIKSMIEVTYTGADDNNYIIEVKSNNKILTEKLNKFLFNRIKYLSTEKPQEEYEVIINELKKEANLYPATSNSYLLIQSKISKLNALKSIELIQNANRFQTIVPPTMEVQPIWPNKKIIIFIGLLSGLIIGIAFELIIKNSDEK